jgi:hypothetical protein
VRAVQYPNWQTIQQRIASEQYTSNCEGNSMKHIYPSRELAHIWAHKTQSDARNSNNSMFFNGPTIFSYGAHFAIAKHVTNKRGEHAVLFNAGSYSKTTSKHQSYVRSAITHLTRFTVPSLDERFTRAADHTVNIRHYTDSIQRYLEKAARARKEFGRNWTLREATALAIELREYGKFFGIKVPKITIPEIADLDDLKKQLAAKAAKDAAKTRKKNAEAIQQWRNGERDYVTSPNTMLRIVGNEVQTSRGARLPVEHACKGLTLVQACVSSGREWVRNGHTLHLGHYSIDRIEANGTVHAGCHVVEYAEIERIAPKLRELCNKQS